jgi:predicted nucleic acid-binding protein
MILDTNFLIDLIQGDEDAVQKAEELEEQNASLKVSSATIFELHTGIERSEKPERQKEKVRDVIDSKKVVPNNEKISSRAGRIHGKLVNQGERIQSFDTIVAATAIQEEEKLLTNDRDFQKIDEVGVENY